MGSAWSSSPTCPKLTEINVKNQGEQSFADDLEIEIAFEETESLNDNIVWRIEYEMDVAYLQRRFTMLETHPKSLQKRVSLCVPSKTFQDIQQDPENNVHSLCNVSALHVAMMRQNLPEKPLLQLTFVLEVFQKDAQRKMALRRRVYAPPVK